ncbi:class I adenylate-forming enzyme family protein [Pusillimonas sp.]|uniref:class I adenylate-forming enzyme family protein n=1 Tax=Pusillimonas sp. TaxID=3040095 RepID=UPI0029BE8F74|nr:class I adenylate-forming enzyme family protein [Pusillimonas sp.]MDX3893855.1 class I adenylate-forming enzyme family protein [Pusillimonas sp.]
MKIDNVTAALASNARRRRDHPAIIAGDRNISHAELERHVQYVAGGLLAEGLSSGQIVGLAMRDTPDHIIVMFAMMRLGVVVLPMDPRWTAAEKGNALRAFNAAALLTDSEEDRFDDVRVIRIDEAWMRASRSAEPVSDWSTCDDSPLLMSLSSGTTGLPKGPMISHGLFMQRLLYEVVSTGTSEDEICMLATPFCFGGGRNITLQNILVGATAVLYPPPYQTQDLVDEVIRHRITYLFLVPTQLRRILQLPERTGHLFPHVRRLVSSGSMLHPEEVSAILLRITPNLYNTYATTDGGTATILYPDDVQRKQGSVGKPAYLVQIEIVDERHQPLPAGEVGRIRYQTLAVADSYYSNPEETKAAFRDGWFYPGDLGRFDDEGYLFLVGRAKDMIIRGGINIFPAEIEAVLAAHAAVIDVAVVPWQIGSDTGDEIAAFVLANREVAEPELLELARGSLARYKIPRRIFFISDMPRNEAGKINKAVLIKMLPEMPDAPPGGETPG